MLVSGTVISMSDCRSQGLGIKLAPQAEHRANITLQVGRSLLRGFLPEEWEATFRPGRQTTFNVANDGTVIGFKVGNFVRGSI